MEFSVFILDFHMYFPTGTLTANPDDLFCGIEFDRSRQWLQAIDERGTIGYLPANYLKHCELVRVIFCLPAEVVHSQDKIGRFTTFSNFWEDSWMLGSSKFMFIFTSQMQ